MERLITCEEAQKYVSNSQERKDALIKKISNSIMYQAKEGKRWDHLPSDINDDERKWLIEELILAGYTIRETNPVINW